MPTLNLETCTLHYVCAGLPTYPPLLLLHGFMGSHQDFSTVQPELSKHFYCIMPDFPGHGKSTANSYSFEQTARDLMALLDQLGISKSHLLGYSMGGRFALYLACCFPERFTHLVLESASPGLKTTAERQERRNKDEKLAQQLETTDFSDFLQQWYSNPLFAQIKQQPARYQAMLARRRCNNPQSLACALRGFSTGRQPSLWQNLSTLKVRLLLLVGAADSKFVAIGREMLAQCQQEKAKLHIFQNCDHNLHLLSPHLYSQTVIAFLEGY